MLWFVGGRACHRVCCVRTRAALRCAAVRAKRTEFKVDAARHAARHRDTRHKHLGAVVLYCMRAHIVHIGNNDQNAHKRLKRAQRELSLKVSSADLTVLCAKGTMRCEWKSNGDGNGQIKIKSLWLKPRDVVALFLSVLDPTLYCT